MRSTSESAPASYALCSDLPAGPAPRLPRRPEAFSQPLAQLSLSTPRHFDCEEGKKSCDHPGSSLSCYAVTVTTQLPFSAPQARSDPSCELPSRTWFKTAPAAWDPLGPPRAAHTGLHTQHFAGTTGPTRRNVYPTPTCPMEGKGVSSLGTPSPFWHPARGQRIGEASHPGPRPRICDTSLIHPAQASIQDSTCLLCLDEVSPP